MPRIAEFLGIVFYLYFNEHGVNHIHAYYAEHSLVIDFEGKILAGSMPKKKAAIAQKFVITNIEMIREAAGRIIQNKKTKK